MTRPWIRDFTIDELAAAFVEMGEQSFRARQVFRWLYKDDVESFDEMTDLSCELRAKLAEKFHIGRLPVVDEMVGEDGTRKIVLELADGHRIECVLIPETRRLTVCVSSQVGCRWGCGFCRTGQMGFIRDLTAGEIVEQYLAAQRIAGDRRVSNVVLMGMGEPLDNLDHVTRAIEIFYADHGVNLSPRKVTLSTVGIVPQLPKLALRVDVSLAVSLHAADDETRSQLVPANRKWPLRELIDACRVFPMSHRRRVTFEYALIAGVNDSDDDAERLVRLVGDLRPKVNLIAVNPSDEQFAAPTEERVRRFQEILRDHNITCMVRKPRGRDILAACGQLAAPRCDAET
ncbi:MAG: 23S rRNA (adenine(2503)-C(2))-methyltransferase RlmN [Candidatus Lernaella stagnicola]|nr:23S rRNA (adenine(2503)-C(2))-methyltransferase RlmN [Candidatus Lernaella stagnicola]